ncbi:MAG: hypothetical protein WC947_10255 [Elusimicrobiota bacterium]
MHKKKLNLPDDIFGLCSDCSKEFRENDLLYTFDWSYESMERGSDPGATDSIVPEEVAGIAAFCKECGEKKDIDKLTAELSPLTKEPDELKNIHAYCNDCGEPIHCGDKYFSLCWTPQYAKREGTPPQWISVPERTDGIAVFCEKCGISKDVSLIEIPEKDANT